MKKLDHYHLLCSAFGIAFGVGISVILWQPQEEAHPLVTATSKGGAVSSITPQSEEQTMSQTKDVVYSNDSWSLLQTAFLVVNAIESQEYTTLSQMVHKEKGIRFTPFSTVNLEHDIVLTWENIRDLQQNTSLYSWGSYVGSGDSISLNISDYFQKFVNPISYSKAPYIAIDSVIISGNALENVAEVYPEARFVDFSFRSIDPELAGQDWTSLKLVFEIHDDTWYLTGIIQSKWTV